MVGPDKCQRRGRLGRRNPHGDSEEQPKCAALPPQRGQSCLPLTRQGTRHRFSGEGEAQNGKFRSKVSARVNGEVIRTTNPANKSIFNPLCPSQGFTPFLTSAPNISPAFSSALWRACRSTPFALRYFYQSRSVFRPVFLRLDFSCRDHLVSPSGASSFPPNWMEIASSATKTLISSMIMLPPNPFGLFLSRPPQDQEPKVADAQCHCRQDKQYPLACVQAPRNYCLTIGLKSLCENRSCESRIMRLKEARMKFLTYNPEQAYLLPPSVREVQGGYCQVSVRRASRYSGS